MRVKCANCGMVYDIPVSNMEFRDEQTIIDHGVCPGCKSNAKDRVDNISISKTTYWGSK